MKQNGAGNRDSLNVANEIAEPSQLLFAGSDITALLVDRQLAVRRFSPAAADAFGLAATDIGRTLESLPNTLDWTALTEDARAVLASGLPRTRNLATSAKDRQFLVQLLPYPTSASESEGLLVNILNLATAEAVADEAHNIALFPKENPCPVLRVDETGTLRFANRAAEELLSQWGCFIGGAVPEFVRQELATALTTEKNRDLDVTCGNRCFSFTLVPIPGRNYVNLYASDVTERFRALEALRDSEDRLRLFVEHAPASLAMFDQEMRYLSVSRRWLSDYGLGERNLIGASHYRVFPEIPEAWREAHRRGLAGEVLKAKGDRFERADGSVQWVRWEIHPWRKASGEVGGIVIFTEDITDHKSTEEALQKSEARYRELVQNANSAIIRWSCDGAITFFNEYAEKFFGWRADEVLGGPVKILIPERESTGADLSGLVRDILVHPDRYVTNVNENICRDGRRVWMSWSNRAICDESGRVSEILAVGSDVTERKQAAERQKLLAETTGKLLASDAPQEVVDGLCRKVMEFLDCQVFFNFLAEQQQRRLRLNACAGISEADRAGLTWLDYGTAICGCVARDGQRIVVEDILNSTDPRVDLVKAYGIRAYACHPLIARERVLGTLAFGTRTRNGFSDDDLELMKAVSAHVAIAMERKRVKEELHQAKVAAEAATQAKGQFLANMSHELRTPMTGVLGMLDLALGGELADEQRKHLEAVKTSAHALLRILNDILDFSRIEAGMLTLTEEPFLIHESVHQATRLFQLEAQRKGLNLTVNIAPDIPSILLGDEGRIRQVLVNLVGNAVKFTDQGEVTVRVLSGEAVDEGRREIVFLVADTGMGIPEDQRDSLFLPFNQGDVSHSRRFGGAGLGLSISKEVVTRMGGVLSFTSEPDQGSTFAVVLPLRQIPGATPATPEAPADSVTTAVRSDGRRPRLLLAEDNPTIRNLMGITLRQGAMDFDVAVNGQEAVAMWSRGNYDLILMDVQMPLMDGFDAVREIRAREKSSGGHIPIVALTAHAYQADQDKCLACGMDAYLAKPFNFQELFSIIGELLGPGKAQSIP